MQRKHSKSIYKGIMSVVLQHAKYKTYTGSKEKNVCTVHVSSCQTEKAIVIYIYTTFKRYDI